MSDKERNNTPKEESLVAADKAAVDEKEASKKVAKAAKGSKSKKGSSSQPGKVARFVKDFKGETKKIVWPDAKMVFKSTGVVILVVAICGLAVFGIDWALTSGIKGLKQLSDGEETTISTTIEETSKEASDDKETTKKDEKSDKKDKDSDKKEEESTTKAEESTTEVTTEETTTA